MVQSSIVIPTNSSVAPPKRAVDETEDKITESEKPQEIKRPRLKINEAGRNRNKRLFGVLLGTLNKFKDDTEQTSEVDKKRREINQKLQEKLDSEKRAIIEKMEARKLEKERMEQMKKKEEEKIIAEKKELFEVEQKKMLANFLKTTTEPNLYYLPDKLTDEMSQTIEKQVQDALAAKRSFEGRRETRMQDSRDDDKLSDNEDD